MSAGMTYSIYFNDMKDQAAKAQLQVVADHVSTLIVDICSLGSTTQTEQLLIKSLDIPAEVSESSYNVSLIRTTTVTGESVCAVLVKLTWRPSIYSESQLFWNGEENITQISGRLPEGFSSSLFEARYSVTSGFSTPVVWYAKDGSNITVGLGVKA
jgi:hypothetical protein